MEKINVAELLKDCPKGMELDCLLCNSPIALEGVIGDESTYPIRAVGKDGFHHVFTKYGTSYNHDDAKCVIFPKGKTTWEGFHRPFKDGDIIRVRDEYSDATFIYIAILKQIEKGGQIYSYCSYNYEDAEFSTDDYLFDARSIRFATEEEKTKLFKAIKDNGYKWNEETKTLEKLIPNKFDINILVPFESKVLVRNDEGQYWIPAFWGCKRADGYTTTFGWCKYCVPFEGNEHLMGKTDDCDKYFKTWE